MNDLSDIRGLAVITDDRAADLISERTRAGFAAELTATPVPGGPATRPRRERAALRARRRWIVGVPMAAGLSGALVLAGVLAGPGATDSVASAAVLITRHGHFIDLIVRDPKAVVADVRKYEAEVKAAGLNVVFSTDSAPQGMFGKLLGWGYSPNAEHVVRRLGRKGFRVPVDFKGYLQIEFGGPAKRGQRYLWDEPATRPREPLAGLKVVGRTVSQIQPLLAQRGLKAVYVIDKERFGRSGKLDGTPIYVGHGGVVRTGHAPGSYFVYQDMTYAPGVVELTVGRTRTMPAPPHGPGIQAKTH